MRWGCAGWPVAGDAEGPSVGSWGEVVACRTMAGDLGCETGPRDPVVVQDLGRGGACWTVGSSDPRAGSAVAPCVPAGDVVHARTDDECVRVQALKGGSLEYK